MTALPCSEENMMVS